MCILFLWRQEKNELCNNLKFIFAANRDEYFDRPAKPAHYWNDNPNVLAGKDNKKGVEGGTWIGITKSGKFGALTNIRRSAETATVSSESGRGKLISNYLQCTSPAVEYLQNLQLSMYSPFNLLAGHLNSDILYMNNATEKTQPTSINKGYIVLTNDKLDSPWLKQKHALQNFRETLESCTSLSDVHHKLFTVLQDKKRNYPDPSLEDTERNKYLSSVFIPPYLNVYGTRTHTIITVSSDNHVTFIEKTKVSADLTADWLESRYEFDLLDSEM